jgi:hypothetical protein
MKSILSMFMLLLTAATLMNQAKATSIMEGRNYSTGTTVQVENHNGVITFKKCRAEQEECEAIGSESGYSDEALKSARIQLKRKGSIKVSATVLVMGAAGTFLTIATSGAYAAAVVAITAAGGTSAAGLMGVLSYKESKDLRRAKTIEEDILQGNTKFIVSNINSYIDDLSAVLELADAH